MSNGWLFHTYKDRRGECRWQLKAANGKIVADSGEGYSSLQAARDGAQGVKDNAGRAEID
jgi:uncharacterized protein YegP (UPF0339 family)